MSTSSKAADILLETGSCFKRIAELTMELVDSSTAAGSSTRLSTSLSSSGTSQKLGIDSSEIKRLRDALNRFSTDLDTISQRVHTNRSEAAAPIKIERLMNATSAEATSTSDQQSTSLPFEETSASMAVSN